MWITGKLNKIENLIIEENPNIVSLNETRTNSTIEAYIYELCRLGYIPIIRSRKIIKNGKIINDEKNLNGGGVALLIRESLVWLDLNAHLQIFGSSNSAGKALEESFQKTNSVILNQIKKPTFYRFIFGDFVSTSTIDYIIANTSLSPKFSEFDVREISAVYDSGASYFHLPVVAKVTFDGKPKKHRKSSHSSFIYERANWHECINDIESRLKKELNSNMTIEEINNVIWHLSLAPQKCAQLTFSKAQSVENDRLNLML